MPRPLSAGLLVTTLGLSLSALPALADLPPPAGYVESCTAERQQKPGETCLSCSESYFGEPEACSARHAPAGYTLRCRTSGASTWGEVWCKAKDPVPAAAEPAAPATEVRAAPAPAPAAREAAPVPAVQAQAPAGQSKGCTAGPVSPSLGAGLVLATGLLAVWRRRRA